MLKFPNRWIVILTTDASPKYEALLYGFPFGFVWTFKKNRRISCEQEYYGNSHEAANQVNNTLQW